MPWFTVRVFLGNIEDAVVIHVVTPKDYAAYRHELDAMHRLRHRVFRERLQWDVSSVEGRERDEFDDLCPTYLLAGDRDVLGTWRLLPTTGPYMLRDVFCVLLENQPTPNDPSMWETSRFAVDCQPSGAKGLNAVSQITRELFCGLVEYCLEQGVREVWPVYDARVARLLVRIGCSPGWPPRRAMSSTAASVPSMAMPSTAAASRRSRARWPTEFFSCSAASAAVE